MNQYMPINATQLAYLKEMGIPVWQRRSLEPQGQYSATEQAQAINDSHQTEDDLKAPPKQATTPDHIGVEINLVTLAKAVLFTDLLQAINISINDIKQTSPNTIQINDLSWSFYLDLDSVNHQHSQLQSPEINVISNSAQLKKALWAIFCSIPQ